MAEVKNAVNQNESSPGGAGKKKLSVGKIIGIIVLCVLCVALICVGIFCLIYRTRFQSMNSIEKLTDYEDGYNIYRMDIDYDYDLDELIGYGLDGNQEFIDAVLKESLPILPIHMTAPDFGCSAFTLVDDDGEVHMGRNYDFSRNTSAMLVYSDPDDGYSSVAFAALDNVSANEADSSLAKKLACLTSPFIILDGMNEEGVSIAVLVVDSEPVDQQTDKPSISTTIAMRLVLDRAATTEEAVELLEGYDMFASSGKDYHFYITDASGDGRVVEYDCDDESRPMVVTPVDVVTNFYTIYADRVLPNQRNGVYGHGKERYEAIENVFAEETEHTNETVWDALKAAAQDPNPEDVTSNTQWSINYNNSEKTVEIALRRNWDDVFVYDLSSNSIAKADRDSVQSEGSAADSTDAAEADTAAAADNSAEATEASVADQDNSPVSYTYQISRRRLYDSAYDEADNTTLLIKSGYDVLSLAEADDDSGNAGTINIILDEINKDTEEQSGNFISEHEAEVKAQISERGDDYTGYYEKENTLKVERADNRVLSVVRNNYTFLGGAHGYDLTTAYSYDAMSGARLKLSDVLTSTDDIAGILADALLKKYPAETFDLTEQDALADKIGQLMDGDDNYEGDNDTHYVTWYVGKNGIEFVFNQYDIAPYAAGQLFVTLTAEDYPDLVNSYYAESPADYITEIGIYDTTDIDGQELTIDLTYDEYGFGEITGVTVNYGEKSKEFDVYGYEISGWLVKTGGKQYLYLNTTGNNDWVSLHIVDLNSEEMTETDFDEGIQDAVLVNPDKMILGTRTFVMSTVGVARSYKVGENGVPEPNGDLYRVTADDMWVTLRRDAEFNVLDGQDTDETHEEEFTKGTRFRLWRTDNESFMDCVTEDGKYVRFEIDTSTYPQVVDGEYYLEDLFEGTIFNG